MLRFAQAIRCPASSTCRRLELPCLRVTSKPNSSCWSAAVWSARSFSSPTSRCPTCWVHSEAKRTRSCEQSTSWLLWAGLLITVGDVLVALWLANRGAQSSAKMTALQQTGVLAIAQIQGLGGDRHAHQRTSGGQAGSAHHRTRVRLQRPETGHRRHLQAGDRDGAQTRRPGRPEYPRIRDRLAGKRTDRRGGARCRSPSARTTRPTT